LSWRANPKATSHNTPVLRIGQNTNLLFVFCYVGGLLVGEGKVFGAWARMGCQRIWRYRHYQHSLFRPASSAVPFVFSTTACDFRSKEEKHKKKIGLHISAIAINRHFFLASCRGLFLGFSTFQPYPGYSINLQLFSLALFAGTKSNFISTRVSFERAFSFTLFVTHSIDSLRCKDENSDNAERSLIIRLRFGPTENGKSGKTRSLGDGERWV